MKSPLNHIGHSKKVSIYEYKGVQDFEYQNYHNNLKKASRFDNRVTRIERMLQNFAIFGTLNKFPVLSERRSFALLYAHF